MHPSLGLIVNGDEPVHVEPRSIDVLVALAARSGQVCSKKELIRVVWGDAFVTDEVLTHAVWELRKAFGDNASDPRYIQTIPKRGYRLIAPVETLEAEPAATARRPWMAYAAGAAILLALAVAVLLRPRPEPAPSRARPTERELLLIAPEPDAPHSAAGRSLHQDLVTAFAGAQGLSIREANSCDPVTTARRTLCIELELELFGDRYEVQPSVIDARTDEIQWAPRAVRMVPTPQGSREGAEAITRRVIAYLGAIDLDLYTDPDIRPWFDFRRHDTFAVGDFLQGLSYTYLNDSGARVLLDQAAERDAGFVAPRVWRIGSLVAEGGDPELLAHYLADLQRLYEGATPFERPMIEWAIAHAAGNARKAQKELKIALEKEPDNRVVRFMLAGTKLQSGDIEGAWELLQPLADRRWRFPGLYWAAAGCAILIGLPDEAQGYLEHARSLPSVDPPTYALLELLAIYRGDDTAAAGYDRKRLSRLRELEAPDELPLEPYARALAAAAESEGRAAAAKKLGEFVD